MDKERRPEAINTVYVARFLIRTLGVEQKTANTMTQDIWLRLMRCVPEAFSCKTCKKIRGLCRCPQYGRSTAGNWVYRSNTEPWACMVSVLLDADTAQFTALTRTVRGRVDLLIDHLNELPG
jgi:hypothetical protein